MSSRRTTEDRVTVSVVVYDLLPPSRFGSFLNLIGSGVYHTSVSFSPPLPLGPSDTAPAPQEYAFGGHDTPNVTGIFSIPSGSAAARMPGLRYYQTVAIGDAFGEEWERTFNSKAAGEGLSRISTTASDKRKGKGRAEEEEGETIAGPPYGGWLPFSRSTTTLKNDADEEDPFSDPSNRENGFEDDDGGVSEGIEYLSPTQRRVWRVLESMKENEGWNGTQYKLLERNCNHFTQELVYRLTGRQAPGWINRASWIATSFPCVVPPGWVDEADEAAPSGENSVEINDSAHALSDSGHVRIEPPRADKMALRGRM